jgi:conjugal transfer/entry exclusion protein
MSTLLAYVLAHLTVIKKLLALFVAAFHLVSPAKYDQVKIKVDKAQTEIQKVKDQIQDIKTQTDTDYNILQNSNIPISEVK